MAKVIETLNEKYPGKVFVLPTCDAMVLAVQYYHRGELPGVEGIHAIDRQARTLAVARSARPPRTWFRSTGGLCVLRHHVRTFPRTDRRRYSLRWVAGFPGRELDRVFRKIAWQATLRNPLTGVRDKNNNGIDDNRE